ncbi:MAG: hypothetical protein HQK96_04335 [Nitrospirae bacterium]|nr:hypothetical protein [Nitrospirota bacterium]
MTIQELKSNTSDAVRARTLITAILALSDTQTAFISDLGALCPEMQLNGLKRMNDDHSSILRSLTNSVGVEKSGEIGNNFEPLHKIVYKFAKDMTK